MSAQRQIPRGTLAFGRYVVVAPRGVTQGVSVHEAYDPTLQRLVWLYERARTANEDPASSRESLLASARVLARLSHPNLVRVLDVEVTDARVQLQTAEVNEVQATRDYLLALFRLERAVGRSVPLAYIPVDQVARPSTEGRTR